ncbi:MAG: ATP-binding cassette domain-containing protein [Prevotella sp.]|nr:ATP-binding cassette domain-containing protein [Prevotella sp.]
MDTSKDDGQGKVIVLAGLNASGKTMLMDKMRKDMKSGSVRYVAFCDTYGTATDRSYYLQQRWNQHDIDQEMPTVRQALERSFLLSGSDNEERRRLQKQLYEIMDIDRLLDMYVISISSGELRKMQLTKTLMAKPQTLILDNPFIGLDAQARSMLNRQLQHLKQQGMTLYLIVARPTEIPDYADDIVWTTAKEEFTSVDNAKETTTRTTAESTTVTKPDRQQVISMHDVTIAYGNRTILGPLSWEVNQGQHWVVAGRNGSGKSTLLSLICADNPQSYACDISLFGRKRGTGESIWEIKRRIGYVSPELHRSYQRSIPALHIVASGLKDTVGLYAKTNNDERQLCVKWMNDFGIGDLAQRPFTQLSSGEQRMVLVCRAFVKNPDLLILDEPMHGLDLHRQQLVKERIEDYCRQTDKTLIMVTHYEEELPRCTTHRLQL